MPQADLSRLWEEHTHEHIYWDQASVLKQIGLLTDETLPVFGKETAQKVLDPSFDHSAPKPA